MNEMHDLTQMLALFKTKINESNLIASEREAQFCSSFFAAFFPRLTRGVASSRISRLVQRSEVSQLLLLTRAVASLSVSLFDQFATESAVRISARREKPSRLSSPSVEFAFCLSIELLCFVNSPRLRTLRQARSQKGFFLFPAPDNYFLTEKEYLSLMKLSPIHCAAARCASKSRSVLACDSVCAVWCWAVARCVCR